jgi:hypothetical protein
MHKLSSIVVVFGIAFGGYVEAQVGSPANPHALRPVIVAVARSFPLAQSGPVILRHKGAASLDEIVMTESSANAEDLAAAALALAAVMDRDGDIAPRESAIRVPTRTTLPRDEVAAATRALTRIEASSLTRLNGVGSARVGRIYLPTAAARAAERASGTWRLRKKTP